MAEVLVLVEQEAGEPKKVSFELLTLARTLGEPSAVVLGAGASAAAEKLGEFGAVKVYTSEAAELDGFLVAPKAEALAKVVADSSPAGVLVASTAEGKEIAARLAVKLGTGIITDAVEVGAGFLATQNIYGGAIIVHSKVTAGLPIITVRPNSVAAEPAPSTPEVVPVEVSFTPAATAATVTERVNEKRSGRPDLAEAGVVVSGGRGLGSGDHFDVVEKLADALGGAVGASRAATDAGWYPHQFQVGQTGKTVSPQLYVALGISGAIQHRAGMQTSKTIVAVNKDPEAPIFEIADFGVVGDLFTVSPQLTEEVGKRA